MNFTTKIDNCEISYLNCDDIGNLNLTEFSSDDLLVFITPFKEIRERLIFLTQHLNNVIVLDTISKIDLYSMIQNIIDDDNLDIKIFTIGYDNFDIAAKNLINADTNITNSENLHSNLIHRLCKRSKDSMTIISEFLLLKSIEYNNFRRIRDYDYFTKRINESFKYIHLNIK